MSHASCSWLRVKQASAAPQLFRRGTARGLLAGLIFSAGAFAAESPELKPANGQAIPSDAKVGKIYPIRATTQNQAVRLTVSNASLDARYGSIKAAEGRRLLVVGTAWENIIEAQNVGEQKDVTTAFKTPHLDDLIYVIADGRTVGRVVTKTNTVAGHIPVQDFSLAKKGDRRQGNLVFDVPADAKAFQIRLYDSDRGTIAINLTPQPEPPKAKSESYNEVLQAGVYGFEKLTEINGKPAPAGTQFIRVDVRAISLVKQPPTKPNGRPTPTVADWRDAARHINLVIDDAYGAAPLSHNLPEVPRLLPDVPTGGQLVFRVPADANSLELVCDFPKAIVSGRTIEPRLIEVGVTGSRPAKKQLKPLVTPIVDDAFFVALTKIETPPAFAGQPAGDGKQWLALTFVVANTGKSNENFQPREQLKFLTSNGEALPMDAVTADSPYAPADPLRVPAEERRTFQAVYRISADESAWRLTYAGVKTPAIVTIPGGTGKGAVATAKPAATAPGSVSAGDEKPARKKEVLSPTQPLKVSSKSFPSRIPARPSGASPKGLAGVGLTPEKLNAAIDRGAAGLWKRIQDRLAQSPSTKFGDEDTDKIVALALVHAGYHKKDKTFDAALRAMLTKYDPVKNYQTYENGIICMTIEAYGDTKFVPQLAASAQWILDQQGPEGTWAYGKFVSSEPENDQKTPRKILSIVGGRPPEESAKGTQPLSRHTAAIDYTDGDNSVSQYAVLGLNAAARSGFELPREQFRAFLKETLDRQNDDGGWSYHNYGSTSYGSMTCAGICAVALSKFELGEKEPWKDESIERGLAWLNAYFRIDDHPQSNGQWIFYYLYSLERVGRILDTEFIGDHEWYPAGSRWLVDNQKPTGLWFSPSGNEVESHAEIPTSFALLFLTRATPALGERKIPQGPGTLQTAALLPPGNRLYVILDCSGSMLEEMGGRVKFDIAKDAIRSLIKEMPDNSEVALRAYGYRLRAIQPGASEDTKLLVPLKRLDRKEMAEFVDGLRCRGKTPMALSLEQAADDLRGAATPERPVTVVLLTDGGEDSQPRKDPVAAAAALAKLENINFRIVGFDINRDEWSQQLTAMATAGRAGYLPATKADELQRELKAAVFGTPESCTILDAAGKPVQTVQFGQSLQLPPGKYQFQTTFGGQTYGDGFYISPGETTSITFDSAAIADAANAAAARPAEPPAADAPVQKPAAKFCKNCGAALKPGAKFCSGCGAKIRD